MLRLDEEHLVFEVFSYMRYVEELDLKVPSIFFRTFFQDARTSQNWLNFWYFDFNTY